MTPQGTQCTAGLRGTADGLLLLRVVHSDTWLRGLREVLSTLLPWEDYVSELVTLEADGTVRYRPFLARYTVETGRGGWNARLLGTLHAALCKGSLNETLQFFDPNQDGVVTVDELEQVLL